ncbi:MAG: hypothetical protein WD767_07895, partial [Alphaproteobacteria bacterium]
RRKNTISSAEPLLHRTGTPEMLFATLVEDGIEMVVAEAGPFVLNPIHEGKSARQLAKRRSILSDGQRRDARAAAMRQLTKLGNECLGQAMLAVRRAIESRLFAAKADADNLTEAALAEIKAAATLDTKLEFNRAAVRGANLMLALTECAWQARAGRLQGIEQSLGAAAKLKAPKFFWLVPRAPVTETP